MPFDIQKIDLQKLNSLTKYPSILTYHSLVDRGLLEETVQIHFEGRVFGTEKVDGTNCRIVFCPDKSVIVGSREDFLWERRDLIGNPAMGIVDAVKETVRTKYEALYDSDAIKVYYLEVFGKSIGAAAKNYTKSGAVSFRLFDVNIIKNYEELLALPTDKISHWRENGGQPFVPVEQLRTEAEKAGFTLVPALFEMDASELPTELEATYKFLLTQSATQCKLDDEAEGIPEGFVVRSADRSRIAKIRREDYERTMKKGKMKAKVTSGT